jgi:hypothetical protein
MGALVCCEPWLTCVAQAAMSVHHSIACRPCDRPTDRPPDQPTDRSVLPDDDDDDDGLFPCLRTAQTMSDGAASRFYHEAVSTARLEPIAGQFVCVAGEWPRRRRRETACCRGGRQ